MHFELTINLIVNSAEGSGPPVTVEQLRAAIPPEGINIHVLTNIFKDRVGTGERRAQFTAMLRATTDYDKGTKLLRLRHPK